MSPRAESGPVRVMAVLLTYMLNKEDIPMELPNVPGFMEPRSEMNFSTHVRPRNCSRDQRHTTAATFACSIKEATTPARAQVQHSTVRVLGLSLE